MCKYCIENTCQSKRRVYIKYHYATKIPLCDKKCKSKNSVFFFTQMIYILKSKLNKKSSLVFLDAHKGQSRWPAPSRVTNTGILLKRDEQFSFFLRFTHISLKRHSKSIQLSESHTAWHASIGTCQNNLLYWLWTISTDRFCYMKSSGFSSATVKQTNSKPSGHQHPTLLIRESPISVGVTDVCQ